MLYIKLSEQNAEVVAETRRLSAQLSIYGCDDRSVADGLWKSAEITRAYSANPAVFASYRAFLASVARGFLIGKSIYLELLYEA